jgi:mannose-6-phosphate isomerase-like protein (cupin superfamily)
VSELITKRFDEPDETVSLPNLNGKSVVVGETRVGKYIFQPGWRWSKDLKPVVGTPSCQFHHQGVVLSGRMHVIMDGGAERTIGPGEAYYIPSGHDAFVVDDEPFVTIEFRGGSGLGQANHFR